MSDMQKKQNFLQGTALLAMATAIVKVIGALYKIPLNAIIGEQGFGYFNTAYDIYNVLLMISTAGLPVAMSRMISQASSLDHYNQVRRIYHTAQGIFLALGIAGSLLMTVFCRQLAAFQNQPDAWAAIGCLGPCVLLICVMSTYRGFFQGQGNMLPTSVSQVLEAVVKLIVGMGAALAILRMTNEIPLAAGGAILGVTASCLVSAIYLFSRFRKSYALLPRTEEEPRSYRETARGLLAIAIPITFGSAALQLMTMLETKIYMGQLLNLGYTQSAASHALRRLEQSLGTQLLQRLHMGVCLTENGRALLPYAAAMLTAQERLIQKAGELSDRVSGTVSVGCISSVAIRWLPELIEHMARRFPAVQIRFQDGSYEDVETWILKKKVDVGFLSAATKQPFRLTPLVKDELLLVLPHGHELCALEEVPPEQLRQQRVIVPAEGVDYDVGDILRRAGCAVTEGASVSSDYAALSLVGQARGVTILPRMLLADHDDRRVRLRYLAGRPTRTICLATLPQHRLSPAAETFCRCAAEMLCGEEAPPRG